MTDSAINVDHLLDLAEAVCDEVASQNDFVELDSILLAQKASRRQYWDYCRMHILLEMELQADDAIKNAFGQNTFDLEMPEVRNSEIPIAVATPIVSESAALRGFISSTFHGTIGFFSQELPFSLLIGAVLTSLGLWFASMIYVSSPEKIVKDSSPPVQSSFDPTLKVVGKITGMVDCKWADPNTETFNGASVLLGRKYALASGLMEITYATGAKVILQGPVTYEVEANGGYLEVGKLTGKLGSKLEIRNQEPNILAFSVRTPTTTITDLGTEFGVEVDAEGVTETRVFSGRIQVTSEGIAGRHQFSIREGQWARISSNGSISMTNQSANKMGKPFIRAMPDRQDGCKADAYAKLVLSMNPFAYYRMERPESTEDRVVYDSAPGGRHGELLLRDEFGGSPWRSGRFGDSLVMRGTDACDRVLIRNFPINTTPMKGLSFSVWAYAVGFDDWNALIHGFVSRSFLSGDVSSIWVSDVLNIGVDGSKGRLEVVCSYGSGGARLCLHRNATSKPFPLQQWQHVAFVIDGEDVRLYQNGVEVAKAVDRANRVRMIDALSIGGRQESQDLAWKGRIDEAAIFPYALSSSQVRQLFTGDSREATQEQYNRGSAAAKSSTSAGDRTKSDR